MLAPFTLNEKLTKRRITGCGFILLGTTMAGCFGNHAENEYTIDYLEATFVNARVLIYGIVFFAWFLVNRLVFMQREPGSAVRGISLGCTAGTIAGNMFCVKAAIELIQRSIHNQDGEVWLHWLPYVSLLGAVFFALTNVVYMTKGLQEYEALFMVTIYEGSMIVSGCVSGAIVLLDLRGVESWRVALYSLSVGIVIVGMYVIFSEESRSRSSFLAGEADIKSIGIEEYPPTPTSGRGGGIYIPTAGGGGGGGGYTPRALWDQLERQSFHSAIPRTLSKSGLEPTSPQSRDRFFTDPGPTVGESVCPSVTGGSSETKNSDLENDGSSGNRTRALSEPNTKSAAADPLPPATPGNQPVGRQLEQL